MASDRSFASAGGATQTCRRRLLAGAATVATVTLSACSGHPTAVSDATSPTTPSASSSVSPPKALGKRSSKAAALSAPSIFGKKSVWRLDIRHAPLNPQSSAMVRNLAEQVRSRYNGVAAFNYHQYNTSIYTVPASTPRADVVWDNCQNKSYKPSQLYTGRAHFKSVPIPADAIPASGNDAEISIWSPSSNQFWEFWKARKVEGQWHACWGGRIDNVSNNPGYFSDGMGASATGLAVAGGTIGIQELRHGRITHAMNLLVVNAATYSTYSYPAQRSDGYDPSRSPSAIPEGIRFRLDPRVNINKLHLTRTGRIVARAAKTYGFIVTDKGGAVALQAESGAPFTQARGRNPWSRLLQGQHSYDVLRNFPWNRLQVLPMNYGKP